ncbi:heparinase II/III domain-containing protein [Tenggerimyces flavus]|uniref:Heparinase II/III family protein n=1 Tax=Tenggerimyces flavus TaxID=1708749 RepID=A0ABV7YN77_9ACTN|nr:heparinase II/III family protein [Tenggerimyces flavus]MBM7789472.1 hypothetical protein [Tenggerimyces flavus]
MGAWAPGRREVLWGAGALLAGSAAAGQHQAQAGPPVTSKTSKTRPTFYTHDKVKAARRNIAQFEWAAQLLEKAQERAQPFLDQGDEWLWRLPTSQCVPRSYAVNQALGSPITGTAINKFGNYPWRADPIKNPWKLVDPSSGYTFPTNDFASYYASGLDKQGCFQPERANPAYLVNRLYPARGRSWGVDDGTGWVDRNGNRWTFVAYYNHWHVWHTGQIVQALNAFRDCYLYTGDVKYARAGLILLDRVADLYPDMDISEYPADQGFLNSDGNMKKGKTVGAIWEPQLVADLILAYDAFFPAISNKDRGNVVDFLKNKATTKNTPAAIRANLENNLLRQVFPAVQDAQIAGNFGMHQRALALAAVVLDAPGESKRWIDFVLDNGGLIQTPAWKITGGGVRAALIDRVDRDGMGDEGAPGYNYLWTEYIRGIADVLAGYDRYPTADLYRHPKVRKLLAGCLPLIMLNRYTPSIGDTGTTGEPAIIGSLNAYVRSFERYGNKEYAQLANHIARGRIDLLYGDIFSPDPAKTQERIQQIVNQYGDFKLESDNLTGYGFAALRTGDKENLRGLWTYYGRTTGHGDYDALNLGLYAFGVDLMPDLGYPEYADKSIRTREWNENTVAHNTVVVDASKQQPHWVGEPHGFASGERVRVVDTSAPNVYQQTSVYRRVSAMVDVDEQNSYVVDIFRVVGGSDHHLSFHAAAGDLTADGIGFSHQSRGTYAGRNVPRPADTAKARPDANGFDWLTNVFRAERPRRGFALEWKIKDTWRVLDPDPDLRLRYTMLTDVDEVAVCDGTPPRNKPGNPKRLRYVVAHRHGEDGNLASQFVSVIEPYVDSRFVRDARLVDVEASGLDPNEAVAVKVTLTNGRVDYIVSSLRTDLVLTVDGQHRFEGAFGVMSFEGGEQTYAFGHDAAQAGIRKADRAIEGVLVGFTRELTGKNTLTVRVPNPVDDFEALAGAYVYVANDGERNAVYRIKRVRKLSNRKLALDLGDQTTIRRFADPDDTGQGFVYDVAKGAAVRIPLTLEWQA